ncbi:MAG TPA: hypothetical protein DGG94_08710 [Micromonosporaceae bacterium]|nr:hypothetical protein [Micromonosporaceae bacterium]HCU49865.1 hypothetical protein [Micromonosporaceae bacterium]
MSGAWFRDLSTSGRMPLFWFFVGVVLGFLFIRLSVRLIRAQVKWWPGNVKPGGLHIHHVVFGVVMMLLGGVAGLVVPSNEILWSSVCAFVFGTGSALVLDEFALILHLKDVYWQASGRTSIDAVFVAVAVTGLLVLGIRPVFLEDLLIARQEGLSLLLAALIAVFHLGLAVITLLKGKIWTGLLGLFVLVLLYVGAIRLARPGSPWARWRYRGSGRPAAKLARANWRERRIRQPIIRAKIWLQELVGGRPD